MATIAAISQFSHSLRKGDIDWKKDTTSLFSFTIRFMLIMAGPHK